MSEIKHSVHFGWSIEKDFDWGRALLGILYFRDWCPYASMELMGNRTMVFRTRQQARQAKALYVKGRGSRIRRVTAQVFIN